MELRVKFVSGAALREERVARHLTQEEAAAEVGVATRTWQLWESDANAMPRAKHRRALIAWLDNDPAEDAE